jgi:hypothetical protein
MKNKIICKNCGSVGLPKKRYEVRLTLALIAGIIPFLNFLGVFEEFRTKQPELTMSEFMDLLISTYDPQIFMADYNQMIVGVRQQIEACFLIWWIIALFFIIWLLITRRQICSKCGAKKDCLIPLESPLGANLIIQSKQDVPEVGKKSGIIQQLEKLSELKAKGVLTQEEVQEYKKRILS